MSRKAFTLVELLVVIIILGLISYIGFPSLMKVITNANAKKEFEYYGQSMIDASKLYIKKEAVDLHEGGFFNNSNGHNVKLKDDLIKDEYISAPSFTKKSMSCNLDTAFVNIKYNSSNGYKFSYNLECQDTATKKKYTKAFNDKEFIVSDLPE